MRILITFPDGTVKKGTVEDTTLVGDLAQRIKIPSDCCLSLAGVPLEADRALGDYGITNGMELEVEPLSGAGTIQPTAPISPSTEQKPKSRSKDSLPGGARGESGSSTPLTAAAPYAVLGVPKSANPDEIKAAYRKLAMVCTAPYSTQ